MAYTKELWNKRIAGRSDISSQVIHLTRSTDNGGQKVGPVDVLFQILTQRQINGSTTDKGFVCGGVSAACFQDVPLYSLAQNIHAEEQYRSAVPGAKIRYMGVGLMFPKPYVYNKGGRPVVYESTDRAKTFLPKSEWWRIVRFDLADESNIIDWTHEREWRAPGDFKFDLEQVTVIVPNKFGYDRFVTLCNENSDDGILSRVRGIVCLGAVFY